MTFHSSKRFPSSRLEAQMGLYPTSRADPRRFHRLTETCQISPSTIFYFIIFPFTRSVSISYSLPRCVFLFTLYPSLQARQFVRGTNLSFSLAAVFFTLRYTLLRLRNWYKPISFSLLTSYLHLLTVTPRWVQRHSLNFSSSHINWNLKNAISRHLEWRKRFPSTPLGAPDLPTSCRRFN